MLTKWFRNLTDESSIQKMNVLLTPSNDRHLLLKTPIFLFIKMASVILYNLLIIYKYINLYACRHLIKLLVRPQKNGKANVLAQTGNAKGQ